MDGRSKSRTYKRDNSRLLNTAFKTKTIKERAKGHFLTSQIHTVKTLDLTVEYAFQLEAYI